MNLMQRKRSNVSRYIIVGMELTKPSGGRSQTVAAEEHWAPPRVTRKLRVPSAQRERRERDNAESDVYEHMRNWSFCIRSRPIPHRPDAPFNPYPHGY